MKKSLLALAVLGAFAGAASAQSSVTVYGLVDVAAQKAIGTKDKTVSDTALGSRLGFRGVEDLGGGLAATFGFEHRFDPSSGNITASAKGVFWNGYSKVGLNGRLGHVEMGRDFTVNFLMVQNQIDPFGGDTVGILRDVGMRGGASTLRYEQQIEYHLSAKGFNFGAQVAATSTVNGTAVRPLSLAANYAAGPLFVAAGFQRDGSERKTWNIGARYNLGVATLTAGYGSSSPATGADNKSFLIGAIVPVGSGNVKLGYARNKLDSTTKASKFGLGYDYMLSKRTTLFTDYARDSKVAAEKSGYDFGIKHSF